jgi:hypothetical protein
MAFDWEQFKRDTACLNEPRTKEERDTIVLKEAKKSWRACRGTHIDDCIFRYSIDPETTLKTPSSLATLASLEIKKQLYIKNYTDLINYITQGDENIYPVIWDLKSVVIRNEIIRAQRATMKEINDLARDISTMDLKEEDLKDLIQGASSISISPPCHVV